MFKSGVFQANKATISPQDIDTAKAVARKMFEQYDKDRSSVIENYEIPDMLQDTYKIMNKQISPSKEDVEEFNRILDRNGDGRVTLADLEATCLRYLCGENIPQAIPSLNNQYYQQQQGQGQDYSRKNQDNQA